MSGSVEAIVDRAFLFLAAEWKTQKGLLVILLFILAAATYLGFFALVETVVLLIGLMIAVVVFWLFISGRIIIPSHTRKTIALCFEVEKEATKNFQRTIAQLRRKLGDLDLKKQVCVKLVASDLIPDQPTAHRYRERHGIDIVVWGKVFHGKENEVTITKFELSHTVVLSSGVKQNLKLFLADLSLVLLGRKWSIVETNELLELKVVAREFFETCMVLAGIYYYADGRFEDGIKVLEGVLSSKTDEGTSQEQRIQTGRIRTILFGLYLSQAQREHESGNHADAIELLDRIPKTFLNRVYALMLLARAHYRNGDLLSAEECTKKIRSIDRKHSAVAFNYAFFGIVQKNYERTRFWYDELLRSHRIADVSLFSVIEFLDEEYVLNPSEHAFLYALAIVNGFIDPKRRKNDLSRFLRLTKNRPEYEVLRKRALELLGYRR